MSAPLAGTELVPQKPWAFWAGIVALIGLVAFLLFARAVERDLNHDEHQFLAPGALLTTANARPYRDYPLFHLPNLIYAYAVAQRLTGDFILGPKLLCVMASVVTATLIAIAAAQMPGGPALRILLATGVLALLLFDPVFCYTAGKTWNHEIPTALALGAFLLLVRAAERDSMLASASAGLCAGLAVGCRLTFAPMLVAMCAAPFLFSAQRQRQVIHAVVFTTVATAALLPSLTAFATAPDAFLFGNLEFPRLPLSDPDNDRARKTAQWSKKVRYFLKEVVRPSWPLFLAFIMVGIKPGWRSLRRRDPSTLPCGLLLFVLPFLLLGCFAPSRYQYQHFFVLIPFLALGVVLGVTRGYQDGQRRTMLLLVFVLGTVALAAGGERYREVWSVGKTDEWFSTRARQFGEEIRRFEPGGKVLTLAPAIPLAAGLPIYAEFATGPFAWRHAHLVPSEKRARLHVVAPQDLETFLERDPPAAILTGFEDEALEQPLLDYADRHAYRHRLLSKKRHLWLAPTGLPPSGSP